jgi:hypothetical protein
MPSEGLTPNGIGVTRDRIMEQIGRSSDGK